MNNKKTILVFIGYYLPGYKSGGPVRTISNMLDLLGDKYNFKIITRDRDQLDNKPYENIKVNEWNDGPNCKIFYANKKTNLRKVINHTEFDQYYLNSLFDFNYSTKIVLLYKLNLIPQKPILLAPRGELMEGALAIKPFKKNAFLTIVKLLKLYKNITWHASSEYEAKDIRREFGNKTKIKIAMDVPNYNLTKDYTTPHKKEKGKLKILYFASITPKKNLKFAIEVLNKVEGDFNFDIYGPIKDEKYWADCLTTIDKRIREKINYKEIVPNNKIHEIYPNYDLFFFPTLGENYGHVIYESLFYGCPVLCTDRTPWDKLDKFNAGWSICPDNINRFREIIEILINSSFNKYKFFIDGCAQYLNSIKNSKIFSKNLDLF